MKCGIVFTNKRELLSFCIDWENEIILEENQKAIRIVKCLCKELTKYNG
jgi:hypothetical protein